MSHLLCIEVSDIIGDAAYSEKENIGCAQENNINLVSKLSKAVTHQQSNRTNPKRLNLTV